METDRATKIRKATEKGYRSGKTLPEIRKTLAKTLGGTPDLYLGTADPVYYRLAGLDAPLTDAKGNVLPSNPKPSTLASAVRRRRDSGVRWNVLAASIEATVGRKTSIPATKALYEKGKGDLDASYVGRGTRVGAPATYEDAAAEVEAAIES